MYHVLLYYAFVPISDPDEFARQHRELCNDLELKGRILVATDGINGTVSGTIDACDKYREIMGQDKRFASMPFKIDEVAGHTFRKMFVRVKEELVTFRADQPCDPTVQSGQRLSPSQWHERIERGDAIVLDGRTDYEYDVGHFRGAIRPSVDSFRDFPSWIRENLSNDKDKPILTYCTGGIRCELLTSFMLSEGFKDVYQLDGGIVTYGKDPETKGALWDGLCYVFDERITVPINHTDDRRVVGTCYHCGIPAEVYDNCVNEMCNRQHLACEECRNQFEGACSVECLENSRKEMA